MLFSSAASLSCVSSCATSQIAFRGDRMPASIFCRARKRPNRTSGIRWTKDVLALAVLCLSALGLFAPAADAQTAHFSGAVTTLTSVGIPFGVAVDRNGNVFFVDQVQTTVKEIVAVNGSIPASPTINTLGVFVQPIGVAVDGAGNVFVADESGL